MALPATNGDALRWYGTDQYTRSTAPDMLGGYRGAWPLSTVGVWVSDTPSALAIVGASPNCIGDGGLLRGIEANGTVEFAAPGEDYGAAVAIDEGEVVLVEGETANKWVLVRRETDGALNAQATIDFSKITFAAIQHNLVNAGGCANYACAILRNDSALTASGITLTNDSIGTAATTDTQQLPAPGGTSTYAIETSDSFADWPDDGYARILTSAGAMREVVYYSARTDTVLQVNYLNRGMHGTTASAGAADDTIEPFSGVALAVEALTDYAAQRIASASTAPVGLTFTALEAGPTIADLAANAEIAVWFWQPRTYARKYEEFGTTIGSPGLGGDFTLTYTYSAVEYALTMQTERAIQALTGSSVPNLYWAAWAKKDEWPDTTVLGTDGGAQLFSYGTTSSSRTLTLTKPLTGTYTYYIIAKNINNGFGLFSQNSYCRKVIIDTDGDEVFPISDPTIDSIAEEDNGLIRVRARYSPEADDSPADTWAIYVSTDGTDPDPATDTPTEVTMILGGGLSLARTLNHVIGPYRRFADVRVLVRARRASDDGESENTAVTQVVMEGDPAQSAIWSVRQTGTTRSEAYSANYWDSYYLGYSTWKVLIYPNETQVWLGSNLLWRVYGNTVYIPHNLIDGAISGAANTILPIENYGGIFVCVNGQHVAQIAIGTGLTFSGIEEGTISKTADAPILQEETALTFFTLAYDGGWVPYFSFDTNGKLTVGAGFSIFGCDSQTEALQR